MTNEELLEEAAHEQGAGRWQQAFDLYEQAFRGGVESRDLRVLVEATRRLGHTHRQAGDAETAGEYFELSLALAERLGDAALVGRALNGIGTLAQGAGELDGAAHLFLRAHDCAVAGGDVLLQGQTQQNLGIICNIRGDLTGALKHATAALAHLEAAGHPHARGGVLNNLGMLHVDLGRLDEADAYFTRALQSVQDGSDLPLAGLIHVNRAELFLARGEHDRARASCDEGFEIAGRIGDTVRQAEALKFYGIIYRETGKLHLAENHLLLAAGAAAGRDRVLEAEIQRELGLVLRKQQRNREALEALNRAHVLFSGLHAELDNADVERRISELEEEFLSLVRYWGETIEAKDRYTRGHCQRVADYACLIAREAGLSEWELTWFRMGAFLHDVGKMEVPADILNKPAALTLEERRLMEHHPVAGDEMLSTVEFPWDVRAMVRSHHERWDGSGYPDGLAGDSIPRAARILRIADIFDALTSVRSYRKSLSPQRALQIMEDDLAGFDPDLFEIFRRLFPRIAVTASEAQRTAEAELARLEQPVG
jgi:putative nucleotidyltransferase with HDIG domain